MTNDSTERINTGLVTDGAWGGVVVKLITASVLGMSER